MTVACNWKMYQNKRSHLTPEQNEPVALASARRAIAEGDLEAASQWARQVISEEQKAKLEAELAAAAGREAP